MDTSKTVDVVMCTYNGERYLREQLDSIIGQTYPIHRLIVQDDRSTDGTVAIVREYAARYPFISLYVNGRNLGYNLNFKSAVMRATADFVAISDQDDVWFADKIARQVEAIGGHNICFSAHVRGSRLEGARRVEPQLPPLARLPLMWWATAITASCSTRPSGAAFTPMSVPRRHRMRCAQSTPWPVACSRRAHCRCCACAFVA